MHAFQSRPTEPARAPAPSAARRAPAQVHGRPSIPLRPATDAAAPPRDWYFAPLPLQTRLAVGRADDPAERAADQAAETVMGTPGAAGGTLRRKCACGGDAGAGGECAACRARRLELQRLSAGPAPAARAAPPAVHRALAAPGRPLEGGDRAFMETRFGRDFGAVRVHDDAPAAESARAVNALAYTVGRDVVFGAGRYAPGTAEGRRLLAHELAHVVQQGGSPGAALQRAVDPAAEETAEAAPAEPAAAPAAAAPDAGAEPPAEGIEKGGGCGGTIGVPRLPISNLYPPVLFFIRSPCTRIRVTLTARWMGGGCEGAGPYPVSVDDQAPIKQFPAGAQGIAEECPGTPEQTSTQTFTNIPAGRHHLYIRTGGGNVGRLDVRGHGVVS
ncbi:MAG TPA: DUF4157 domain-containing protein [Longimicrobium sp.]|jgi:hypothetical protein